MLIAIDHGNKNMKTVHHVFTSGLAESDSRPPFGENILQFNGKYYVLSEQRIPYLRDKTVDDRFFILTLFAIALELETAGISPAGDVVDIQLAVGLPPLHFGSQYKRFEEYFKNHDIVDFRFRDKSYSIWIDKVCCYPQAYAAAIAYQQVREQKKVMVLDLGGFTLDFLRLRSGRPDFVLCDSMECGVITLYNDIIRKINSEWDLLLEETDIDAVLQGENTACPEQVTRAIHEMAQAFIDGLAGKLRERMIDLRIGPNAFVGGGAQLLRRYIEASDKVGDSVFITDLAANVRGYTLLYTASNGR